GGIIIAGFEPVRGDAELGCEFAQCSHARAARVRLEPADVRVGDALAGEVTLAEAEREPALTNSFADGRHVPADGIGVHCCPGSNARPSGDSSKCVAVEAGGVSSRCWSSV